VLCWLCFAAESRRERRDDSTAPWVSDHFLFDTPLALAAPFLGQSTTGAHYPRMLCTAQPLQIITVAFSVSITRRALVQAVLGVGGMCLEMVALQVIVHVPEETPCLHLPAMTDVLQSAAEPLCHDQAPLDASQSALQMQPVSLRVFRSPCCDNIPSPPGLRVSCPSCLQVRYLIHPLDPRTPQRMGTGTSKYFENLLACFADHLVSPKFTDAQLLGRSRSQRMTPVPNSQTQTTPRTKGVKIRLDLLPPLLDCPNLLFVACCLSPVAQVTRRGSK
jgi:hypothetical protein